MSDDQRRQLARLGAPAAFLLACTIFVLILRSGGDAEGVATTVTRATTTQATTGAPPATTEAAATTAPATTAEAEGEGEFYEIQSGDTLETVAVEQGTTVDALVELNPGIDPRALTIGQRIRVR